MNTSMRYHCITINNGSRTMNSDNGKCWEDESVKTHVLLVRGSVDWYNYFGK